MKNILLLAIVSLLTFNTFAQSPDLFSYQAVVRDNAGNVVVNQVVSVRFSILQTTATGSAQYVETHSPTTDANGLVSLMIGGGTVTSGTFLGIDWATDKYFLKVELDPAGGSSYSNMGTTQLISVPYAKHAETAMRSINDFDTDSTNELQALRKSGDTIFLSNGGFVELPNNLDNDSANELQTLSISNDTIFLSNGGFAIIPDSSLLGVRKGGSGLGLGGSLKLNQFDNDFDGLVRIGDQVDIYETHADGQKNVFISGYANAGQKIGTTVVTNTRGPFLAKLDSNGALQWVQSSSLSYARISFVVDNSGNSYMALTGAASSVDWNGTTYNFTITDQKGVILKLSPTGSVLWNSGWGVGGFLNDRIQLAVTNSSELLFSTAFSGVSAVGNTTVTFKNGRNFGLFKISSSGASASLVDSCENAVPREIAVDNSGNYYALTFMFGGTSSSRQFKTRNITTSGRTILLKYNSSASITNFSSDIPFQDRNGTNSLLKHDGTSLYVGGVGFGSGGYPFVLKMNSTLNITDTAILETVSDGFMWSLALKSNGEVVTGNQTEGPYLVNDESFAPLSSTGKYAALMAKYSNALQITDHKLLKLFNQVEGFRVTSSGNTAFCFATIPGNFYNKGTKYTPGVYLFKE